MQKRLPFGLLCFLFLLITHHLAAQDTLLLTPSKERLAVQNHLYILPETSEQFAFKTAFKQSFVWADSVWELPTKAYWGKLYLYNPLPVAASWHLLLMADQVDVYVPISGDSVLHKQTGIFCVGSQLDLPKERTGVRLELPPQTGYWVYARLQNFDQRPHTLRWFVQESSQRQQEVLERLSSRNLWQGIFQGMLWIMIIYNLLVFSSVRDKSYLFYALYLMSASLYFLLRFGFLLESVFYQSPKLNIYSWVLGVGAIAITYHLFLRAFFDTRRRLPKLDTLIRSWILTKVVLTMVALGWLTLTFDLQSLVRWSVWPLFLELILSMYILWQIFRRLGRTDGKSIRYFILGTAFLLTGLLIYAFYFLGIRLDLINWSWEMLLLLEVSILIEVIFFSLGLGHRMRQHKSERLQAQSELILQLRKNEKLEKNIRQQLEKRVRERTEEISQQKIHIERKNQQLQTLNDEKNHLIRILAHDLRNPLTSALSVADLMQSPLSDEERAECLAHIRSTLERMNSMITRILDLKSIDNQELPLQTETVALDEILQNVCESFSQTARQKNIRFKTHLNGQIYAPLDRNYALQVFENLISNALKFSPAHTEIQLALQANGTYARAEIRDQGPGIALEEQVKLFKRYQQLSARPTDGESSNGIGLSVVKKYVEAMQGRVWCESEPGKGANFIVEFPMAQ